jgi:hypothetical protein
LEGPNLCANNQPVRTQITSGYPHQTASIHRLVRKKQRAGTTDERDELFQNPMPAIIPHLLYSLSRKSTFLFTFKPFK